MALARCKGENQEDLTTIFWKTRGDNLMPPISWENGGIIVYLFQRQGYMLVLEKVIKLVWGHTG